MSIEWDIEELAYRAMGKTQEQAEEEINNGDIDDAIHAKYEVSFESYCAIIKDLAPFLPKVQSSLSGETFAAFVDSEENRAIVKFK